MNLNYSQRKIIKFLMLCETDIDKYIYTVDDEGYATLVLYLGNKEHITVPTVYEGYTVKHIGPTCFNGNTRIQSAVIPEGIISIQ